MTDKQGQADSWRQYLGMWAIPDEILTRAPQSPWHCPPNMFTPRRADVEARETPSMLRALEVMTGGETILDVGVGGGAAGLSLCPPGTFVIGVDVSRSMLDTFVSQADIRGVRALAVEGSWPSVQDEVGLADVVVSHNVLYNVADLVPFLLALTKHARRRVVIQISASHPRWRLAPLWKHFWKSELPLRPTAQDAAAVAREAGLQVGFEQFEVNSTGTRDRGAEIAFLRQQLCLTAQADDELDRMIGDEGLPFGDAACIWWDVGYWSKTPTDQYA